MGTETTPIPSGAEGLKELVNLAGQARGIDLVTLTAPMGADGIPSLIPVAIRHGATPELLDVSRFFEPWRAHPEFKKGTASLLTLQSFVDLVNRHKTEDTAIFAHTDWRKPHFEAVIDYHAAEPDGDAGNLKHRLRYEFPLSEEWKAWVAVSGEKFSQADFAAFLQDHIADLSSPYDAERIDLERDFQTTVATPSQLMTLSRSLQVNVNSAVKNAITLQTGEGQIQWSEEHTDGDGKPLKVPGVFLLNIAPFFMGEKTRVPVLLRYRANAGRIDWTIVLYRPDIHVTERVRADLDTVSALTERPCFEGSPEA